MESIDIDSSRCITKGKDILGLLTKRGALDLLCIFCCSDKKSRFNEIHQVLNHLSTKTLASRLKEFTKNGIMERTVYKTIPPKVEYALTTKGQSLIDVIEPLIKWIIKDKSKKQNIKNKTMQKIKFKPEDFLGNWV
jgi:DNA-binding HxlR family transcriptional regulator